MAGCRTNLLPDHCVILIVGIVCIPQFTWHNNSRLQHTNSF